MDYETEIYLDHAAATPLDVRVRQAMEPYLTDMFFNPSAPYAPAWHVRQDFESARATLAHAIGAKPAEVVITAGATESINLAFSVLNGVVKVEQGAGTCSKNETRVAPPTSSLPSSIPLHVVTTAIEHPAVLACAKAHAHTLVPVNKHGLVAPEDVRDAITPETRLVSIGYANNEIGTVQPLRAISEVVAQVRQQRLLDGNTTPLYFHTDASQCAGQLDVNVSTLGVDMLTLNAAKMYGPKQVGLLWAARGVQLQPLVLGGGQERGLRSGTENVAGAVGFACALQLAVEGRKEESKRLAALRDSLQRSLLEVFPEAVISGHKKHRLPGLLHISFPGIDAERLVYLLEERGVYVATGAACAANKATGSHVLDAIGLPEDVAGGSLRLSLGTLSNEVNTARAAEIITEVVQNEYERARG